MPVGEMPLIQEIDTDGACATPELYMRPSPSPPLESESAPPPPGTSCCYGQLAARWSSFSNRFL